MKLPHFRLHFTLFDGKTPLWWVTKVEDGGHGRSTGGYVDPANAVREAAKL